MEKEPILKITVNASGKYDVLIGRNIILNAGELISQVLSTCKVAVVTDDRVDKLYSSAVIRSLERVGYEVVKFVFPNGEKSKNLKTYGEILGFLAENELTRTDAVVALGGGVVGDMAGFAAATYLRGIKYIQIPTTLLAQIDSSVGGKTAIDLEQGKNLVGAFCQPSMVICDVETLNTLPDDIFTDGMGEVVKYCLLDKRVYDLVSGEEMKLLDLIYYCIDYKRKIVEEDEFESGSRRLLNLGHTPAHGIEKLSKYNISHGKAVAMGVKIILDNSLRLGYIDKPTYEGVLQVIDKCVQVENPPFDMSEIRTACLADKKRSGNSITLIMAQGVGDCRPLKINIDELKEYLV
ncbi:MAG: 3-dehydroquinate synthase [Clostridia bacterium]|nr:3-dehydroquinate synthase [Clostridia bacterium]